MKGKKTNQKILVYAQLHENFDCALIVGICLLWNIEKKKYLIYLSFENFPVM